MATQDDVFNLKNNEQASTYLQEKKSNSDGLLRPKLEEGRDGKRELVVRFLPNLSKQGKIGPTAIEKHIHYANFKANPELQGYYDCLKNANIGEKCPLCDAYWALKNSKNPAEQDKAGLISRTTKYYAYVLVVEDKQVPDNEGKIFIFPFGYKIFAKMKAMAEATRKPCQVEDLIHGANLNLVIQEVAGFYNYDASMFEAPEPIEIDGKTLKVDADGTISPKERQRVVDFLLSRDKELDEFMPQRWTEEQHQKVSSIIAILTGVPVNGSNFNNAAPTAAPVTSAAFFGDEDDEDEQETPAAKPVKATKATKAPAAVVEEVEEDIASEKSVAAARKRSSKFFDDED